MNLAITLTLVVILAVANHAYGLRPTGILSRRQLSTSTVAPSRIFDPLSMSDKDEDGSAPGTFYSLHAVD